MQVWRLEGDYGRVPQSMIRPKQVICTPLTLPQGGDRADSSKSLDAAHRHWMKLRLRKVRWQQSSPFTTFALPTTSSCSRAVCSPPCTGCPRPCRRPRRRWLPRTGGDFGIKKNDWRRLMARSTFVYVTYIRTTRRGNTSSSRAVICKPIILAVLHLYHTRSSRRADVRAMPPPITWRKAPTARPEVDSPRRRQAAGYQHHA